LEIKTLKRKYSNYFKSVIKDIEIEDLTPKMILDVECILLGAYMLNPRPKADEAWTILSGYPCYPATITPLKKKILINLQHKYKRAYGNKTVWDRTLELYRELPFGYRLFEFKGENDWYIKTPEGELDLSTKCRRPKHSVIKTPRLQMYYELLKLDLETSDSNTTYAIRSGLHHFINLSFTAEVEDHNLSLIKLQGKRKKKGLVNNVSNDHRLKNSILMEKISGNHKWKVQAARSSITRKRKRNGPFAYIPGQTLHILGGVGVGKNSWIEEELFCLFAVERKDIYTCVVLSTVNKAYDLHETLSSLGLDAVVITGLSNKENHEVNYMEKVIKKASSFKEIFSKDKTIEMADSECQLTTLHNITLEQNTLPCQSVFSFQLIGQENEKVTCPYFMTCGRMKAYREMSKKRIWITTPHALLQTRLPKEIDPNRRILQEVVNDFTDIIYFDEVDDAMKIYDENSVMEVVIAGGNKTLIPELQDMTIHTLRQKQYLLRDEDMYTWNQELLSINQPINSIYRFLQLQTDFITSFLKKPFTLQKLGSELVGYFEWDSLKEKEDVLEDLLGAIQNVSEPSLSFSKKIIEIIKNTGDLDFLSSICTLLPELGVVNQRKRGRRVKSITAEERAALFIEFFSYILQFETSLRKLTAQFPLVKDKFGELEVDSRALYGTRNKLLNLIKAPSTGHRFGYRIVKDGRNYTLKLMRYVGKARELLTNWNDYLEGGPAVVGLSGTSYAPDSPHFDVKMKPYWKLINQKEPPKIEIFKGFAPSIKEEFDYHYVSGTRNEERDSMLKEITDYYISGVFEPELTYWKNTGENRKVLVAATNYDDVEKIASYLQQHPEWKGRFAYVSNRMEPEIPEAAIKRAEIEGISEENKDILIAPLSVIARGYNILQKEKGKENRSYFGTVCLFVRPYYIVDDLVNSYVLLHGYEEKIMSQLNDKGILYGEYMKQLHQKIQLKFMNILTKPYTTLALTEEEMKELSWYTLILVIQLCGRLLRGDTPARLIIADAKMDYIKSTGSDSHYKETSMINNWMQILNENMQNQLFQSLYGPFKDALENLSKYSTYGGGFGDEDEDTEQYEELLYESI
jgi:hypothetical protein